MDTRTKLPRTLHSPAFEKLSPWPVAAAHAPTPGGEAAQMPVAEVPPTCNNPDILRPRMPAVGQDQGRVFLGKD